LLIQIGNAGGDSEPGDDFSTEAQALFFSTEQPLSSWPLYFLANIT